METWEDWDYWLRMAKAGKCFYRLDKELVRYRMYTGNRRYKGASDTLEGRQIAKKMLQYITDKEIQVAGCRSCGGGGSRMTQPPPLTASVTADGNEFVKAIYIGKGGSHHVYGVARFSHDFPGRPTRRRDNGFGMYYGYIGRGETVNAVHIKDIELMPGQWQVVQERIEVPQAASIQPAQPQPITPIAQPPVQMPEPPKLTTFNLEAIPGVTPKIATGMREVGLDTKEAILKSGIEGLVQIKGVAEKRAELILAFLEKQ